MSAWFILIEFHTQKKYQVCLMKVCACILAAIVLKTGEAEALFR